MCVWKKKKIVTPILSTFIKITGFIGLNMSTLVFVQIAMLERDEWLPLCSHILFINSLQFNMAFVTVLVVVF